jgi:hypothetical protein
MHYGGMGFRIYPGSALAGHPCGDGVAWVVGLLRLAGSSSPRARRSQLGGIHGARSYPVHRNLHQRVTFFYLELEDLFLVIGLAAVAKIVSASSSARSTAFRSNFVLQFVVLLIAVPALMLFKYGKPRGYIRDLILWHTKPRIYCGLEPDGELPRSFAMTKPTTMEKHNEECGGPRLCELLPCASTSTASSWCRRTAAWSRDTKLGRAQQASITRRSAESVEARARRR